MMKTIYQPKVKKRGRRLVLFFLALIVLLFTLNGSRVAEILGTGTRIIFRPLFSGANATGRGLLTLGSYFQSKSTLTKENESLKTELAQARAALFFTQELAKENQALKESLGHKPEHRMSYSARVLHKPNQSPYDTLIVDLGSQNSLPPLQAGFVVLAEDNWLVGEVLAADSRTAKIGLFSSPGRETPVLVGEHELEAVATGLGGGSFSIQLPHSVEVKAGEVVRAVTDNEARPIGLIAKIKSAPSDPFQLITFKNPINIYELGRVQIYGPQN